MRMFPRLAFPDERVPRDSEPPATIRNSSDALYERSRRVDDCVGGAVLFTIARPLQAVASLAILIEDGSPIIFSRQRVGRRGRMFMMFKLRTMPKGFRRDESSPTASRDPRITRVGRRPRAVSIDELPQLLSILRGRCESASSNVFTHRHKLRGLVAQRSRRVFRARCRHPTESRTRRYPDSRDVSASYRSQLRWDHFLCIPHTAWRWACEKPSSGCEPARDHMYD
jgi:hypothetical protein